MAVRGDLSKFNQDLKGADRGVQSLGARLKGALNPTALLGGGIALAGAAVVAGLAGATKALIDIERLNAQTDATIRSTGGVANVTRAGIEELAEGLESLTTTERETVQEGANLLLTFKRIRNEAGEGNDIFDQATATALDLSVALGTDMRSASMMLGKALDDPIRGVTALRRAGVALTEQQQEQVKAFVESGDILSAQKIILAELESQVGGSAEAFAETTAGKIQRFQNDIGNMFESIILGAVKVADFLGQDFDPIGNFAMDFGEQGSRIHALSDAMGTDFQTMKDRINADMEETGGTFEEVVADMEMEAKVKSAGITDAMSEGVRFGAEAIRLGGPVVAKEAGKVAGMLPSEIQARVDDVRQAGMDSVVAFAAGILDKQRDPMLAMEALTKANEETLTRGAEIARLKGQLTSKELANGLNDSRPEVRLAAQAARAAIVDRLRTLNAWQWGYNVGSTLAAGMAAAQVLVRQQAVSLSSATGAAIRIESEPDDPKSGLRGITKWGGNIVQTITDGIYGNLGTAQGAAGALAGALTPSLGMPSMALGGAGAGAGVTNQWILHLNGVPKTFNRPEDMLEALMDLGAFGEGRLG